MSAEQATCACGCGEVPAPRRRYIRGHNRRRDPMVRFWERVQKTETCWLWTGSVTDRGYGQFGVDRKMHFVHRFAYELLVGPIPDGLQIDHVHARGCRHKTCVNPDHLEPVTGRENQARAFALITHCPQGHEYTVENMLTRHGEARKDCRQCNREASLKRYHAKKVLS